MDQPLVKLEETTVYRGGRLVLDNINLEIPPGSFYALIGPNGSGKTTLIKTILGLLPLDSGRVQVFGCPSDRLGEERYRLGYVPQGMPVDLNFPVDVLQVVLMSSYGRVGLFHLPGQEDYKSARGALERVGMVEEAHTPISELSGGQLQRVFVARALASEPELLLLDEPTTGVDFNTSESFYELLHELVDEGVSVVLVSHDVGVVARHADLVACLNRRLIVHGSPDEVLNDEVIEKMYGEHASVFPHAHLSHDGGDFDGT